MLRFLARFLFWCVLVALGGVVGVGAWRLMAPEAAQGSLGAAVLMLLIVAVWPVLVVSRGWKLARRAEEALAGVQHKGPPPPEAPVKNTRRRPRRQAALFTALFGGGIVALLVAGLSLRDVGAIFAVLFLQIFKEPLGVVPAGFVGLALWGMWSFCGRVTSEVVPDGEAEPPAAEALPPVPAVHVVGSCPRCVSRVLAHARGSLNEDVCPSCAGHFLPTEAAHTLLVDHLGLSPAMLKELLTHFAGTRLTCPSCSARMSPVTLKGVNADLCGTCGGVWLDRGELRRVSGGRFEELGAPSPKA